MHKITIILSSIFLVICLCGMINPFIGYNNDMWKVRDQYLRLAAVTDMGILVLLGFVAILTK